MQVLHGSTVGKNRATVQALKDGLQQLQEGWSRDMAHALQQCSEAAKVRGKPLSR